MRFPMCLLLAAVSTSVTFAEAIVVKQSLSGTSAAQRQVMVNGGMEERAAKGLANWEPWDAGYTVDDAVAHGGKTSARCDSNDPKVQHGLTNTVVLNQQKPAPIVAEAWSRAQDVSVRNADTAGDYSLYLDLEYMDGTPLWGQIARFHTGTHDWEYRKVVVVPTKPIKLVHVHAIFRNHTGTVWFDDFRLSALDVPAGTSTFDTFPVTNAAAANAAAKRSATIKSGDGYALTFDLGTGEVIGDGNRRGGFMLRDYAAQSDFRRPLCPMKRKGNGFTWEGRDEKLDLALKAEYASAPDHISIKGEVRDLIGRDRAVTVYFALPVDAVGWTWGQDIRRSQTIQAGETYSDTVGVGGVGANRNASKFPLAALSGPKDAVAAAVALTDPRLCRLAYDAGSRELYVAFDLGLVKDTANFPSSASFAIQLFRYAPEWQYRAALAKYYALNPEAFRKRVTKEGLWMAFTDIATVAGHPDFGFVFHEGDNNPPFDAENGYLSLVYVEPMSFWMSMAKETPRTGEAVLAQLKKQAEDGPDKPHAQATYNSGLRNVDGEPVFSIENAPWCDGAMFVNNPDPTIKGTAEFPKTQFDILWDTISNSVSGVTQVTDGWVADGAGFELAPEAGRTGAAAKCVQASTADVHGAYHAAAVIQATAEPLIARGWSRAENVTGTPDKDYALYCDVTYTDGTNRWGFVAPFEVGTHGWQKAEVRIVPEKPVANIGFHLLFRGQHTGTVWFDDASLVVEGTTQNLLTNPGFEPVAAKPHTVDGNYIDSSEMAASDLDFSREHWRDIQTPLTFATDDGRPAQMVIFATRDFAREVGSRLHPKGKLMFANSTPWRFPWLGPCLDVLGTETNWAPEGKYQGESDEIMCYRREVCYQKPYCLLQNTEYGTWSYASTEKYFKRCTAYAVFPGFFSANAATNCYFTQPALYNRDRPLFKRYVPIIKRLAGAGWEPLTGARSDKAKVYVERYGSAAKGNLLLTVYNDTDTTQTVKVTLDPKALGLAGTMQVTEMLADRQVQAISPATPTVTLAIAPEDVVVLSIGK